MPVVSGILQNQDLSNALVRIRTSFPLLEKSTAEERWKRSIRSSEELWKGNCKRRLILRFTVSLTGLFSLPTGELLGPDRAPAPPAPPLPPQAAAARPGPASPPRDGPPGPGPDPPTLLLPPPAEPQPLTWSSSVISIKAGTLMAAEAPAAGPSTPPAPERQSDFRRPRGAGFRFPAAGGRGRRGLAPRPARGRWRWGEGMGGGSGDRRLRPRRDVHPLPASPAVAPVPERFPAGPRRRSSAGGRRWPG